MTVEQYTHGAHVWPVHFGRRLVLQVAIANGRDGWLWSSDRAGTTRVIALELYRGLDGDLPCVAASLFVGPLFVLVAFPRWKR